MHSEDGVCRFSISFEARSRIAPGTGVHCVRQRSDVDLVEKGACTESGRPHLAEVRDRECRKGQVHQVFQRNVRYVNDALTSSNRSTESCGTKNAMNL